MLQGKSALRKGTILIIHVATMSLRQADPPERGLLIRRYVWK